MPLEKRKGRNGGVDSLFAAVAVGDDIKIVVLKKSCRIFAAYAPKQTAYDFCEVNSNNFDRPSGVQTRCLCVVDLEGVVAQGTKGARIANAMCWQL